MILTGTRVYTLAGLIGLYKITVTHMLSESNNFTHVTAPVNNFTVDA